MLAGTKLHDTGFIRSLFILAPASANLVAVDERGLQRRRIEDPLPAHLLHRVALYPDMGVGIRDSHNNVSLVIDFWKDSIRSIGPISRKWAESDLGSHK